MPSYLSLWPATHCVALLCRPSSVSIRFHAWGTQITRHLHRVHQGRCLTGGVTALSVRLPLCFVNIDSYERIRFRADCRHRGLDGTSVGFCFLHLSGMLSRCASLACDASGLRTSHFLPVTSWHHLLLCAPPWVTFLLESIDYTLN